jgi:hypothetical protein
MAVRYAGKQRTDIRRFEYLQVLVRCIIPQTAHLSGSIIECQPLNLSKTSHPFDVKAFLSLHLEMQDIGIEAEAHHTPEVVPEVGIEELHRPTIVRGRKTSQKEDASLCRQEGLQGMGLNNHLTDYSLFLLIKAMETGRQTSSPTLHALNI